MIKASDVASLYEVKPAVSDKLSVQENSFLRLMNVTKGRALGVYDRLAYLAGIKSAPLEDQYHSLDVSSLQALLMSAKKAGFSAQVLEI